MIIAFNIGDSSSGILSYYPIIWKVKNFKTFQKNIRKEVNIEQLFKWAKENHVPPSLIIIYISIKEGDFNGNYSFKAINIREYRLHWEKTYKQEWK